MAERMRVTSDINPESNRRKGGIQEARPARCLPAGKVPSPALVAGTFGASRTGPVQRAVVPEVEAGVVVEDTAGAGGPPGAAELGEGGGQQSECDGFEDLP